MKYSDTIIPWKKQNIPKNKNKLDARYTEIGGVSKTQKELYVQTAVRNPDFDQTISEVNQRVLEHSTKKEQTQMATILTKVKTGKLEYEDLSTVEILSANNYKYLFLNAPESTSRNIISTTILIALITVALVALRIAYAIEYNSTLLFFISIINIIANAYTFLGWPTEVACIVDQWLQNNNIKPLTRNQILNAVSKKLWILSSLLLTILIGWLLISHFVLSHFVLGSDIVSIVALGVSILNSNIIKLLATYFEKHIYYDK